MAEEASSKHSERVIYLHGDLDLNIIEARSLPNMDLLSERFRLFFSFFNSCNLPMSSSSSYSSSTSSRRHRKIITSDPYVTLSLKGATVARTRVISNSQNPTWNEHFCIPLAHPVAHLDFLVKDDDVFGADVIGVAAISAVHLSSGDLIDGWFPLAGHSGTPHKPDSSLRLQMRFVPCLGNPLYTEGRLEVRDSYFPARKGGCVTLYQDAHVPDSMLPEIELEGGRRFKQEKCWEDMCHAILEAHHMVYIVGWSIYHKVRLVREPSKVLPSGGDLNLGELLKYKSQEGVRVLLLVWDDKTSHNKFFLRTDGVMQTHDEETRRFFKHSSVNCMLSPRYASNKLSIFKQQVVGTLFTHHQKCLLVDTQASGNNRKIIAFLGGLDLCDGRYDTPEHRLFHGLHDVFHDDFHNPAFSAGTRGPRQPWHDLHCKIEGPAAYDVLTNFEQRWKKATKWSKLGRRLNKISHWRDDALIKLERISWILTPSRSISSDDPLLWASKEEDAENWHVQIFRSIDSGSLKGFPKDVQLAEAQNLVCAKDLVIDKSIQTAYIQAIRSAQHFIYIENQYFLGSSYAWPSYRDAGADNLIPMELALKIASKIRAKERFAVYVVIPMWPEGIPSSSSVQEILFWQSQTMQMMYEVIAKEMEQAHLRDSTPQHYLNFYCLGNREEFPQNSPPYSDVISSQKFQRFMVYVHAKGMIVDDEYVLLGSANINQRSLAGSRDTEIAMGAYQSHYTWASKQSHPLGQVYGYRMSLWAEHMGGMEGVYREPERVECVDWVNRIAEDNWVRYTANDFVRLQGHILKYPLHVGPDGKVGPLPGHENFPDIGGKVIGSPTTLPDVLTT